jgi:hypothetical protein
MENCLCDLYYKAISLFENGNFEESIKLSLELKDRLYETNKNDSNLYYESILILIGFNNLFLDKLIESKMFFEKVLTLNPFSPEGAVGLSICLKKLGYQKNSKLWIQWLKENDNLNVALNSFYLKKWVQENEFEFDS